MATAYTSVTLSADYLEYQGTLTFLLEEFFIFSIIATMYLFFSFPA